MRSKTLAQLVELSEAMLNGSKLRNGSGSIPILTSKDVVRLSSNKLFGFKSRFVSILKKKNLG